jgi:hypothetical protein
VTCRLCGRANRSGPFYQGGDVAMSWCMYRARLRLGLNRGLAISWRTRDIERMRQARGQA